MSRHSRLAQRKKRARDSEAADSLLQLSKHPCITADRDGDFSGNGNDCSSADSAFPSADSDALVSQLQEELATVKCEKSKLEMEKKVLELKAKEL